MRTASLVLAALLVVLAPAAAAAQAEAPRNGPAGEPPLTLPRIPAITLDGRVDEGEWADAVQLEGVMHLPDFGAEPSERTVWYLGYDSEHLYVGCRAYDSEPEEVRVTTLQRDVSTFNTDACGIRLDTYNDEENSLLFNTTPAGVRTDWAFANDASGGPPNMDWNTFWDAAGTLTEYGWSGEIRIPFSSLGFQVEDGRTVMGFALARSIVRRNEQSVHPAIPPNWGPASLAKPSQMRKMILTGLEPEHPVYVTPYALGGGGHTHALNGLGDAWDRDDDTVLEGGLDVRYGLTRNLNLDLSVNTDFAQVEADDQQVNLTRFSLFFPEKRRFFQERAAIFEFPLGFNERLFHSRRIGLVAQEPVRIFGGGRLVGRVGDWDVGFIDMQTDDGSGASGENLGVLRARRRVLNQFSYVGGILTSRIGDDGGYNVLYGTDAVVRLFGQDYLTLNWAQSFDDTDDLAAEDGVLDRSLVRVNLQRRGTDGPLYSANLVRAGAIFQPGMGFLRRRDYLGGDVNLGYGWRPGGASTLNRYGVTTSGSFVRRNAGGTYESGGLSVGGDLETRGGHGLGAQVNWSYEDLTRAFSLSPEATVPVGSYRFVDGSINYRPPMGALFRPSVSVSGGRFYDGSIVSAALSPAWSVSRHLALSGAYEINRVEFGERGQDFTAHVGRLRTELSFTTSTSAAAFVQYNSADDVVVLNFRFRYNPTEGTDLYVVWNESLNSDRYALSPVAPLSHARSLLVKYARTFTLSF
ncbi:MAG TPA: DUF5916 domain-containing protein [Longimicrobiales bacterium]|nr:DUF5916 domain-containing protein [Longimicrobiales bacterium]